MIKELVRGEFIKPEKRTVIKHGDMYFEEMRCSFCPECSELNAEYTVKDAGLRGAGPIKYAVTSYKYECKNCGCIWSEDDIIKRRVKLSDEMVEFLMTLLSITLVCAVLCINVVAITAAVKFIESFF